KCPDPLWAAELVSAQAHAGRAKFSERDRDLADRLRRIGMESQVLITQYRVLAHRLNRPRLAGDEHYHRQPGIGSEPIAKRVNGDDPATIDRQVLDFKPACRELLERLGHTRVLDRAGKDVA